MRALLVTLFAFAAGDEWHSTPRFGVLEIACQYPKAGGTVGEGRARFATEGDVWVSHVTYAVGDSAVARESRGLSGFNLVRQEDGRFASAGNVVTLRDISSKLGLIDDACIEAVANLVAQMRRIKPANLFGESLYEPYLFRNLEEAGWLLVAMDSEDRSDLSRSDKRWRYVFRAAR
jgi:hypothetical protein